MLPKFALSLKMKIILLYKRILTYMIHPAANFPKFRMSFIQVQKQ